MTQNEEPLIQSGELEHHGAWKSIWKIFNSLNSGLICNVSFVNDYCSQNRICFSRTTLSTIRLSSVISLDFFFFSLQDRHLHLLFHKTKNKLKWKRLSNLAKISSREWTLLRVKSRCFWFQSNVLFLSQIH